MKKRFMNFLKGSEQSLSKFNDLKAIIKELTPLIKLYSEKILKKKNSLIALKLDVILLSNVRNLNQLSNLTALITC